VYTSARGAVETVTMHTTVLTHSDIAWLQSCRPASHLFTSLSQAAPGMYIAMEEGHVQQCTAAIHSNVNNHTT